MIFRRSFFYFLALATAIGLTSPANAKQREAKLPSGLVDLRLGGCSPETPVEKLCQIRADFTSASDRFLDEDGRPTKRPRIHVTPYRMKKGGELRWGATYRAANGKRVWLVEPVWADLELLSADLAIAQKPGSGEWFKLDTIAQTQTLLGTGHGGLVERLASQWLEGKSKDAYFARDAGDGTDTLQLIRVSGEPGTMEVDRMVPAGLLPKRRAPVEALEDGTLLLHRLDANGRVFDQIFSSDMTVALTGPMPPLLIADYGKQRRYTFLEIDRQRRLFWPVRGSDIRAKPPGMLGLRPVSGRFTAAAEPISETELQALYSSADQDNSPYAAQMPICSVNQPGCDFSSVWSAIWSIEGAPRIALLGESLPDPHYVFYDLPTFEEFAGSAAAADYVLVRALSERGKYQGADIPNNQHLTNAILIAQRSDGLFEFLAHKNDQRINGKTGFALINEADTPLNSEPAAVAYANYVFRKWTNQFLKRAQAESDAKIALAKRGRELREAAARQRQGRLEVNFNSALNGKQFTQAIRIAWSVGPQAVYRATMAALQADRADAVGRAEIQVAQGFASPGDQALLSARERALDQLELSMQRRFVAADVALSGGETLASEPYVDTNKQIMDAARFESRMNYLSGNTSSYLCGSASFCD